MVFTNQYIKSLELQEKNQQAVIRDKSKTLSQSKGDRR